MTAYMAKYGAAVLEMGYDIVAIRPGSKAPLGLDWTKRPVTDPIAPYEHEYWVDKASKQRGTRSWSIKEFGIGALTEKTPLVDVDVRDKQVAEHMVAFTRDLIGDTIERTGLAPKTGLLYRAEHAFPKVNSATYLDGAGQVAKVEILGAGQQFVALAVHPDTHQPYRWKDKKGVHNTPLESLPTITHAQAQAIRDEFDRVARSRGWSVVSQSKQLTRIGPTLDDDPFADVAPKVSGVSPEEMRRLTMLVPGYEEYETWREIGMALYHQFDGSDEGLEIWDDWSAQATNYDEAAVRDKWPTFDIDGKARSPLTARVILERSKEAEEKRVVEATDEAIASIMLARSADELQKTCTKLKSVPFLELTRNMLVQKVRERYKTVTNTSLPVADARRMLRYEDQERVGRHTWLAGFVYVQFDNEFYNPIRGISLTPIAFDSSYSRNLLTPADILEGKSVPEHRPQDIARNVVQVEIVSRKAYMPGLGDLFSVDGERYVNLFTEASVPDTADEWTVAGKAAVETVKRHAEFLFGNERDRGLFLDALAYVVQTQQRPNWAVFIQGVGGDGKTFWGDLMASVLGSRNATIIRGAELKEKYTSWAEGHLFCMIEEVRLTGEHRYDAVNNLKPYITNTRVPIRTMHKPAYTILNRTFYMLTSNTKDGLPTSEGERYLVLYSNWQDEELLRQWKDANPSYFTDLWAALNEGPSLRRWLMERKLSAEFDPKARAPVSSDMDEMRALVVDDETAALKRVLDSGQEADFSRTLLDSAHLVERMVGSGAACPSGRRLSQLMSQQGMTYLGETGFGGKTRRWWSNKPKSFQRVDEQGKSKLDGLAVQSYLNSYL